MLASAIGAKEGTRGRIQGVNEANIRFMWSANQPYNSRKPPREPPVCGAQALARAGVARERLFAGLRKGLCVGDGYKNVAGRPDHLGELHRGSTLNVERKEQGAQPVLVPPPHRRALSRPTTHQRPGYIYIACAHVAENAVHLLRQQIPFFGYVIHVGSFLGHAVSPL